jgi:3-oxoacyl-[acyl-carrier protein] reductase
MGKLERRVAIVTGGGTGIGRSIALEFAKEGADVVVSSRNLANLEKVAEEIKALGRRALAVAADVSIPGQVDNIVKQTIDKFSRIDILVNNAGTLTKATLLEMTEQVWDEVLDTNLKGVFLCTQAVARQMMKQKYGKIINIASIAGRGVSYPGMSSYCASKAGVIELTMCYAKELGPHGVNVNAIAPGMIVTDILTKETDNVEQFIKDREKLTVLGKTGAPQDIANLSLFLATEDSSFISGQTIPIDGGRTDRM